MAWPEANASKLVPTWTRPGSMVIDHEGRLHVSRAQRARAISAFTRVHSPSKTGVNALNDALWQSGALQTRDRYGTHRFALHRIRDSETITTLSSVGRAHAAPGVAHLLVVRDRIVDLDPEAEDLR